MTRRPNITQRFGEKGSNTEAIAKSAAAGSRIRRGPNRAFRNTQKTPLNIIAMLSTVGIQEPSSKPKPVAPLRSARPTLMRRAFNVAIPAPRKTPKVPMYGLVLIGVVRRLRGGAAGALRVL